MDVKRKHKLDIKIYKTLIKSLVFERNLCIKIMYTTSKRAM